jgi:hypothetical protein
MVRLTDNQYINGHISIMHFECLLSTNDIDEQGGKGSKEDDLQDRIDKDENGAIVMIAASQSKPDFSDLSRQTSRFTDSKS